MFKLQICYISQQTLENPSVNLNALWNSYAKIACCSSELVFTFRYAGSCIQNASKQFASCINLSFVYFALHPTPPTEIYRRSKQLYLGNQSELDTCSYELFFSQWPIISHPKILTFSRESPCLELGEPAPAVAIHSPTAGQDTPSSAEQGSGSRVGLLVSDGRQTPSSLHKTKLWSTK